MPQVLYPYTITDAVLTSSSVPETDHAAWVSGTTYAAGDRVIRTGTHRIYERLIPGAGTTPPESDSANWLDAAPTNRWAMFDGAVGTRTTATTSISVTLNIPGAVNDIVLMDVTGSSISITLPDASRSGVAVPASTLTGQGALVQITGLASAGGSCTVTLTGTGTVAIGIISIGTYTSVGNTCGVRLDLSDYSRKEFDAWGGLTITPRNYQRRLTTPIEVPQTGVDQLMRVAAALRSTPAVWSGLSGIGSSVVWGYLKEASVTMPGGATTLATGSLTVQSMAMGGL